jgi:hypothetical protein
MLARLTGRVARIAATLGDAPAVLRASPEFASREPVSFNADSIRNADALTAATAVGAHAAPPVTSEFVARDTSLTADAIAPADVDASAAQCRSVSTEAADVTVQLQRLRAMRARGWRIGHRAANATHNTQKTLNTQARHASRSDPLLALDERAPMIAAIRLSGMAEFPAPGLICIWRTRMERGDGEARGRAGPPLSVLTVMHIACGVPKLTSHRAIAAFVRRTLGRADARIQALCDRELAAARERLRATDRERIERLAGRDDAIASELAAMLRARAASGGAFQPLLFEDIAIEKTTMKGADIEVCHVRTSGPLDAGSDTVVADRLEPALVMALVLR